KQIIHEAGLMDIPEIHSKENLKDIFINNIILTRITLEYPPTFPGGRHHGTDPARGSRVAG
ncbi:hypothetical protein, partial [Frankia sp. KB5]|uniref:hypothetical protein n=1 Tax=Frankia sp. KB5 TaxID=683318 RepID=UPI001A7E1198